MYLYVLITAALTVGPHLESPKPEKFLNLYSANSLRSEALMMTVIPPSLSPQGIQLRPQNITYIHTLPSKISQGDSGFGKQVGLVQ